MANPYHIKTLLQLLLHVSCRNKLKILSIFQTLLRIQVPISVFDESVRDLHAIRFRTQTKVDFKSSFAKFFFLASLQIQAKTWDSVYGEERRGGMYDVNQQLTRTVALVLKVQDDAAKSEFSQEMSKACI